MRARNAGKSPNQLKSVVNHLAFSIISANRRKPKTSGGTLGSLKNRKWPYNEPLEILAFWKFDIERRIFDNSLHFGWMSNNCLQNR